MHKDSEYIWLRLMVMGSIIILAYMTFYGLWSMVKQWKEHWFTKNTGFLGKTEEAKENQCLLNTYYVPGTVRSISLVLSHSFLTKILWRMSYHFWVWKLRVKGLVLNQTMMKCHIIWFHGAHTFYCTKLNDSGAFYFPNLFQASL